MSVATPKSQARETIQLDVILVCRNRAFDRRKPEQGSEALKKALARAVAKAARLLCKGFELSRNDRRVILYGQFLAELGPTENRDAVLLALSEQQSNLNAALDDAAFCDPIGPEGKVRANSSPEFSQRLLFE